MSELSILGKKWIYKKYDASYINFLKENFHLDEITSKLLSIRNIDKNYIKTFLKPSIKNLIPDPNVLKDMKKTTDRVAKAITEKEKIGIFGDYDVDGASSTALIGNYFKKINQNFEIYIPDRKSEGYGPSIKSFQNLIDKKVTLIITVDCGTMSFEAIDFANTKGVVSSAIDQGFAQK